MAYVDSPNKKQKHPHYEHRTAKLETKNNDFDLKKFQHCRKASTHKKILKSFQRIGMCLNSKSTLTIPNNGDLDKVCFIVVNDYKDEAGKLGVGPLNDGYLFAVKHYRIGFKIFYLYNCPMDEFLIYLEFMMKNTAGCLTVFYSGRDDKLSNGIRFSDGILEKSEVNEVITNSCSDKKRIFFITDCLNGGSVFDINGCPNAVSFYVEKKSANSKEAEQTHGVITYYFCKIVCDYPAITPEQLVTEMNDSVSRFNERFLFESSSPELAKHPIFPS